MQVNEFVKRIRAAKIHVMIMGHLRAKMPAMMGKQKAQEKMLRNLSEHFSLVQREHHLPLGKHCALPPSAFSARQDRRMMYKMILNCIGQPTPHFSVVSFLLPARYSQAGTCAGDFPDVNRYRDILSAYDISNFPKLREKDIKAIDDTLSYDIPALVRQFDNPYN